MHTGTRSRDEGGGTEPVDAIELMEPKRAERGVADDRGDYESGAWRNSCGAVRIPPIGRFDDPSAGRRVPIGAIPYPVLRNADERRIRKPLFCPHFLAARRIRQERRPEEMTRLGASPDAGAQHKTTTLRPCSAGQCRGYIPTLPSSAPGRASFTESGHRARGAARRVPTAPSRAGERSERSSGARGGRGNMHTSPRYRRNPQPDGTHPGCGAPTTRGLRGCCASTPWPCSTRRRSRRQCEQVRNRCALAQCGRTTCVGGAKADARGEVQQGPP